MKNQALFSLKDKSKKLKCRLLQFLSGTSRVNVDMASCYNINMDRCHCDIVCLLGYNQCLPQEKRSISPVWKVLEEP